MSENREITASLGIYMEDIRKALQSQGIEPTGANVQYVAQYLRNIASAWAKATLQDEKNWQSWLDDQEQ